MYRRRWHLWLVLLILVSPALLPASPAAASSTFDDTNSSLSYSGSWAAYGPSPSWTRAVNSTLHSTTSPSTQASVQLTFTGSIVTYMYTMASNRGSAKLYIDGYAQAADTINAYAPETRWRSSRTFNVGYGTHSLYLVTNGDGYFDIDAIGIDGNFATGTSVYEDTSVDKFGSWTTGSFSSASGGTTTYSQTAGDGVNFAFYGSGVSLIFARATNRGYAKITIDGNDMGTIDQYGSSIQWQQRVDFRGLAAGYHVINVTVAGAKQAASSGYFVDVDGFQIAGCPTSTCRAYAVQLRNGNFTSVSATLTHGVPAIRDGGFSAEVLWMGDINGGKNYMEVGWRRTVSWTPNGMQENQTRLYWGYWDENAQWHGPNEEQFWLGEYTTSHILEIRKVDADSYGTVLAVYVDWIERSRIYFSGLTANNMSIESGGEVTNFQSGVHNAMGVGDFSYLWYDQGYGYIDWAMDAENIPIVDYSYQSAYIGPGHWQTYGYN